jgi:hypothetical protein
MEISKYVIGFFGHFRDSLTLDGDALPADTISYGGAGRALQQKRKIVQGTLLSEKCPEIKK